MDLDREAVQAGEAGGFVLRDQRLGGHDAGRGQQVRAMLREIQQGLGNSGKNVNAGAQRMKMLTGLLRLRQVCCDLRLVGIDKEETSAKLDLLDNLVGNATKFSRERITIGRRDGHDGCYRRGRQENECELPHLLLLSDGRSGSAVAVCVGRHSAQVPHRFGRVEPDPDDAVHVEVVRRVVGTIDASGHRRKAGPLPRAAHAPVPRSTDWRVRSMTLMSSHSDQPST